MKTHLPRYRAMALAAALSIGCGGAPPAETGDPTTADQDYREPFSKTSPDLLAAAQGNLCILKTINNLGLYKYKQTDPQLLADILQKDMLLSDLPSVQTLLGDRLQKPRPLTPMLVTVARAVAQKHPPLVEFLCEAHAQGLIPVVDQSQDVIKRVVHHTYLLEILTQEMADNWQFMVEIQDHLLAKREAFGIPSDFMGSVLKMYALTGDVFEPIKTKTMDWVFSEYQKIRERGTILPSEIAARQNGTKFNILEASIAENLHGYNDNAMAGIALAINPPKTIRVVGDNRFLEYELSQEWDSLYESWNLAFITGNISHLHVIYAKLFIPSVIDAEPDDYLFNRALSLWVAINFHLFAQLTQQPDHPVPNAQELATLWGQINHKYGKQLVLDELGADLSSFSHLLGMTYDMLWAQLKQLLIASGVITPDEAQQLSDLLAGS